MQTIRVQTTQNVFIHYPLASIGDRILAYLLDRLILVGYSIAIAILFISTDMNVEWVWLIFLAFPWLFFSMACEILMNGQTPGKRVMKIKVVRLDGTPPSIGDYILRWIFGIIDFSILSGAIAVVFISAGGKGQRLGDIVAGTSVVKLQEQAEISAEKLFVVAEESYTPVFTEASNLNSRDIELIQQALEVNRNHGNTQPVILMTEKIKSVLNIQTDLPPVKFLYTIVRDYNHITSQVLQ